MNPNCPDEIRRALRGVAAVLVTPYRRSDGAPDEASLEALTGRLDTAGIHGLTALGNTAEMFQLRPEERAVCLAAIARARRQAVLIAGVSGAADQTLRDIDYAASLGYDAAMLHEPADPFGDSEGLGGYYRYIADRSGLPLIVYLRSPRLETEGIARLVMHRQIVGVKYARRELDPLRHILRGPAAGACTWMNGAAESRALEFLELGITGFTSGIANARPDLPLAVLGALIDRDQPRLEGLVRMLAPVETLRAANTGRFNVAVIKALLGDSGGVRPPHSQLSDGARRELDAAIAAWPEQGDAHAEPAMEAGQ